METRTPFKGYHNRLAGRVTLPNGARGRKSRERI